MKVIFDLDYTLLDTARFKEKLAEIFSEQDFFDDYDKYFKAEGVNFDYEKYLEILRADGKIGERQEKIIKFELEKLMNWWDDYVLRDAENVLKYFQDCGHELILITFGNKNWQAEKVKYLSIGRYFDRVIFEENDKSQSEYLKALGQTNDEVLIINDNIREAKEMLEILKKGKLCKGEVRLVKGPYSEGEESQIDNLAELMPEKSKKPEATKELYLR